VPRIRVWSHAEVSEKEAKTAKKASAEYEKAKTKDDSAS